MLRSDHMKFWNKRHGRRRGTAAVELAVSLIPLMMIVMGIIESGRLMSVQEIASNAVREGARLSTLGGSTIGSNNTSGAYEVDYRVRSYLNGAGVSTGSATITVTDLDQTGITDLPQASPGDRIQVTVSMPYSSIALSPPWFFGNATIVATGVMRKEAP
jgi:Flp pilus assembly protein TadG